MRVDWDLLMAVVAVGLGGCGTALVGGAWLKRDKGVADWSMAIGATLATLGCLGLIAALARVDVMQSDEAAVIIIGMGTMGVVLFTMGFVVDRVRGRASRDHQELVRGLDHFSSGSDGTKNGL